MAPEFDLSVVIPARDEERFVRRALASVAGQTWPPARIEVVVVDNASRDGTADAVRAFACSAGDLTVRLVREPVPGIARAKNRGAAAARGACLVFLDADSRMAPDLAARVMRRLRAGCGAGSIRIMADSRDPLDRGFFDLLEFGKRLFRIHAQMFFCRRDLFLRLGGFDERLRLAEDRDFLLRAADSGALLCRVSESWIATSPRRLHALPFRLGMVAILVRWALAHWGVGRGWRY